MLKAVKIWNRDFKLKVICEDLDEEGVLDSQLEAAKAVISDAEMKKSEEAVKEYIKANNKNEMDEDTVNNVFRYVMPGYIFIPRKEYNQDIVIMCDYRFDMEHGIAVVFRDRKYEEICRQDAVI